MKGEEKVSNWSISQRSLRADPMQNNLSLMKMQLAYVQSLQQSLTATAEHTSVDPYCCPLLGLSPSRLEIPLRICPDFAVWESFCLAFIIALS